MEQCAQQSRDTIHSCLCRHGGRLHIRASHSYQQHVDLRRSTSGSNGGKSFGVLELELLEKSYAWKFISEYGQVLDSGAGQYQPAGSSCAASRSAAERKASLRPG